jgi:hypothetical protein
VNTSTETKITEHKRPFNIIVLIEKPSSLSVTVIGKFLFRKRVIMKLQNPSASWQIFACLNIIDPILADELGKKYYNVWRFDTIPER